jgi:branched-chain amino acid transport system ATP-binding protein
MLRLKNIFTEYDRIPMLRDISLNIEKGELVCLLGSNGAGKTTTVKTIIGIVKPKQGEIEFEGQSIRQLKTNRIIKLGISIVPEGRRLFPKMTVLENLRLGAFFIKDDLDLQERLESVFRLFPVLRDRKGQLAGTLSGGEQGMAAIGRGIMSRPKIMVLDEPSLGLAPKLVQEYFKTIDQIKKDEKTTMLLIEQNAAKALSIADKGYLLQKGKIIAEGTALDLKSMDIIKQAYLKGAKHVEKTRGQ